jgi:hypothetical protein
MRKPRKTTKRSVTKLKQRTFKPAPENHRFDQEISDVASNTLLRLRFMQSSKPISMESSARKLLREVIAQRKLTWVATKYFNDILQLAAKRPLVKIVVPLLESTFEEFYSVKKHLDAFSNESMQLRVENMFSTLNDNDWQIIIGEDQVRELTEDIKFIGLRLDYSTGFNQSGDILSTITIFTRTDLVRKLSNIAYHKGIIFYTESYYQDLSRLLIFHNNNIPWAPLLPELNR